MRSQLSTDSAMCSFIATALLVLPVHAADTPSAETRRAALGKLRELNALIETDDRPGADPSGQVVRRVEFNRPVSDGDLTHLCSLPEVQEVTFGYWAIWEGHIHGMCFAGRNITDDGLRHLAQLRDLRKLGLQWTQISDKGLDALHQLSDLEEVDLLGTNCTAAGVKRLRKALPSCEVIWE